MEWWRQSVRSEHLRLYVAADACKATAAALASLRLALGTSSAPAAAEALLAALDEDGTQRSRVETLAAACARTAAYNELTAQQVVPGLWVGPLGPAESEAWLSQNRITHVLDGTGGWRRRVSALENGWAYEPSPSSGTREYLQLAMEDRADFDIAPFLAPAVAFIRRALEAPDGAILVHCHSGVSRSATLALAYLIEKHALTVRCATRLLQDARPACRPNDGFAKALLRFEIQARTARRAALDSNAAGRGTKRPLEAGAGATASAGCEASASAATGTADADAAAVVTAGAGTDAAGVGVEGAAGAAGAGAGAAAAPAEEEDMEALRSRLPVTEVLGVLSSRLGSVPTFARVADAIAEVLHSTPLEDASRLTIDSFHDALRRAIGNGRGLKVGKLRVAYATLFDAAVARDRLPHFTDTQAANIAVWALAAATHPRLCKPEKTPIGLDAYTPAAEQLCDVLRRLRDERSRGGREAGGNLRESSLKLLYEVLEVAYGLTRHAWARPRALEALALAKELGAHVWGPRERAAIDKWLSTARARGIA